MNSVRIFLIICGVLNVISFLLFLFDKLQAKKDKTRIPEALLFSAMLYMGTLGGVLAMITLRHKIRKWYFWLGLPMLFFSNYLFFEFVLKIIK